MEEQFLRTQMLMGKDNLNKLQNSRIIIFGIGGVGGYIVEALARCGVCNMDIVDNDKISITNLNRQIVALYSTIGRFKVDVMKDRILDINPKANVKTYKIFYTKDNKNEIDFSKYDYVIDAIDTTSSKLSIAEECYKTHTPIISSMGTGNKMNPMMLEITDIYKTSVCPLARIIRQELKKRKIPKLKVLYSKEKPIKPNDTDEISNKRIIPASNSFVPATAGLIIASEVIKDLINYKEQNNV